MNEAQQWQYLTTFVQADAQREESFLREMREWKDGIPNYTPEAMMPRLDALGQQGWELVHMQPVTVGNKSDILTHAADNRFWTSTYFCVFKRPQRD